MTADLCSADARQRSDAPCPAADVVRRDAPHDTRHDTRHDTPRDTPQGASYGAGHGTRIVAAAERWLGTPYRHQGSALGIGCDCLGLVRGIWRELYGAEPAPISPYAPDWAERSGEDRLTITARRLCGPALPREAIGPGDVILFRWRSDCAAKHLGILVDEGRFIHAYEQAGVVRSALAPSWRRRITAVHRLPASPVPVSPCR